MESSPGIQSICHPLEIRLPISLPLPSGHGRCSGSLLDLDSYGGTDPLGMFTLFLKKTAVVFRRLLRLGSFPVCWRVANVIPIPKGLPSSSASNYRSIYLTPILSKVFECLVSVRLGRLMGDRGVLPTNQFAYRKGLVTCDAFFVWHTPYRVLWRWGRRLE